MKFSAVFLALVAVFAEAYVPQTPKTKGPAFDLKNAAAGAFAAMTIASSVIATTPADAIDFQSAPTFSSSTMVSEKVVREGLYREYEVDIKQDVDDARSTFKGAKETKSKKGKYTALLAVLIVGSFIIPMAQYFWYVRDDDSSDRFFAEDIPEPEPEKKKKGWFN